MPPNIDDYEDIALFVDDSVTCLLKDPSSSGWYSEESKFLCFLNIEYSFANALISKKKESDIIGKLKLAIFEEDLKDSKVWAGVALGFLARYYPPEEVEKSNLPIVHVDYKDYGGREKGVR